MGVRELLRHDLEGVLVAGPLETLMLLRLGNVRPQTGHAPVDPLAQRVT